VVHHDESVVVANARQAVEHSQWILQDLGVYRLLERFFHMERSKSPATDHAFARLEEAGQKMNDLLTTVPHSHVIRVTIEAVQNLLDVRRRLSPDTLNREVLAKRESLESAVVRMQDLLTHACTARQIDQLEEHARHYGFEVSSRSLQYHQANLVGWVLEWRLPA
jgi:hypothetical protein